MYLLGNFLVHGSVRICLQEDCIFLLGWLIHTANVVPGVGTSSTGDHGFETSLFFFAFLLFCSVR